MIYSVWTYSLDIICVDIIVRIKSVLLDKFVPDKICLDKVCLDKICLDIICLDIISFNLSKILERRRSGACHQASAPVADQGAGRAPDIGDFGKVWDLGST